MSRAHTPNGERRRRSISGRDQLIVERDAPECLTICMIDRKISERWTASSNGSFQQNHCLSLHTAAAFCNKSPAINWHQAQASARHEAVVVDQCFHTEVGIHHGSLISLVLQLFFRKHDAMNILTSTSKATVAMRRVPTRDSRLILQASSEIQL